jgi:hypothetical protein
MKEDEIGEARITNGWMRIAAKVSVGNSEEILLET